MRRVLILILAALTVSVHAEDLFRLDPAQIKQPGITVKKDGAGTVSAVFESPGEGKSRLYCPVLPAETLAKLNGKTVYLSAEINFEDVTEKPKHWNGVKLMLGTKTEDGKEKNSQANIPIGCSDDWTRFNVRIDLSSAVLKSATLVIGLENVGGVAGFRDVRITDAPVK